MDGLWVHPNPHRHKPPPTWARCFLWFRDQHLHWSLETILPYKSCWAARGFKVISLSRVVLMYLFSLRIDFNDWRDCCYTACVNSWIDWNRIHLRRTASVRQGSLVWNHGQRGSGILARIAIYDWLCFFRTITWTCQHQKFWNPIDGGNKFQSEQRHPGRFSGLSTKSGASKMLQMTVICHCSHGYCLSSRGVMRYTYCA